MRALHDVRTRLLLVVLVAVAIALIVATVAFNVLLYFSTLNNADSLLRSRAGAERELIQVVGGKLRILDAQNDVAVDSRIWIFAGSSALEAPREPQRTLVVARSLTTGASRYTNVGKTDERLYSLPIVANGRRVGTVVSGVSLAPYEQTRRSALLASLIFAGSILVIAGLAAAWLLRSALRPVAVMTQQAESWSEHDLDGRFGLGEPHDELTRLASTLDRLLDRIAASLRHERRFSAELSHELRTPLAKLSAEAELALRRPRSPEEYRRALGEVHANAQQIARIVDALLAAARQEAGPRGVANATDVARAAAEQCRPVAAARGVELTVADPTRPYRVGVDLDLAERILHPVLDNACRYATSRVDVALAREDGVVVFTVVDDGPGVEDSESELIFEPAQRGRAGLSAGPSAGLGLALARRLARSVSGEVVARKAADGARFAVSLPAA